MENKLGVDVDVPCAFSLDRARYMSLLCWNRYRIFVFQNLPKVGTLKKLLPVKFIGISNANDDKFLREHFKWRLAVQFSERILLKSMLDEDRTWRVMLRKMGLIPTIPYGTHRQGGFGGFEDAGVCGRIDVACFLF